MTEIDPKIVEHVYKEVLDSLRASAFRWGKDKSRAEDAAVEAIARMLESHRKVPIRFPLHWARKAAYKVWGELGRGDGRHVSYHEAHKAALGGTLTPGAGSSREQRQVLQAGTDCQTPEVLAEQRDFLQKIDPNWQEHIEEGYDFSRERKLDRNVRRQIQRRARALSWKGL